MIASLPPQWQHQEIGIVIGRAYPPMSSPFTRRAALLELLFFLPWLINSGFGRRKIYFFTMVIYLIFVLPVIFVKNSTLHLIFRFCTGFAFQTNFQMPYIIVMELLSPDKRALASYFSFSAWTMSMCVTSFIAWIIPDWTYLAAFAVVPSIVGLIIGRFLPESPRWLLAMGKLEECTDVLMQVANTNKRSITRTEILRDLQLLKEIEPKSPNVIEIFRYPIVIFRVVMLVLLSVAIFIVYSCVLINIDILPDNYFLNYFILSFMEFPSNIISLLHVHYLGRRATIINTFLQMSIFSVFAIMCHSNKLALLGAVGMLKVFSTQGIYISYVYASELFPTPIRSTATGVMAVGGMIGFVISPYIVYAQMGATFQYYVILGVSLGGLLGSFLFPETIGLPLPQTFDEAERIGKDRSYIKWIHHWNKHKYSPVNVSELNLKS